MTIVRVPNALTTNTLGRTGVPFPVSMEIEHHPNGAVEVGLYPIDLRDAIDVIVPTMLPFTLLTEVETIDITAGVQAPIHSTLAKYGIEVVAEDSDTVLIATSELQVLFGDLWTCNLAALDLPSGDVELAEVWYSLPDKWPALPSMTSGQTYLSTHDDVYLHAETRDDQLAVRLCQRLLAILVGTHLFGGPGERSITRVGDVVSVPFIRRRQRPFDRIPDPTHQIS